MGINNLSQLPPDLQAAAASVQPGVDGPRLPVPDANLGQDLVTPAQPTGLATPSPAPGSFGDALQNSLANPTNGKPLTFNDKLKTASNAASAQMTPAQKAQPGAWARSLIAGAQHALGSVEDSLGDAATAASGALPGEGGLAAIGRIHNAETARKQEQVKQQSELQKNAAAIAASNVQTMYHQTMLHQLSDELNEKDIVQGKAKLASMTTELAGHRLTPGTVVASDITESQLQKAMNDKSWDPSKETYMATGSFDVPGKKDEAGNPLKQKTYTIVSVPQEQVLNKDQVDMINKYVQGVHFDYNPDKPDAVKLPGAQALNLITSAEIGQTAEAHRDQELKDAKLKNLDTDTKIAADEAGQRLNKNVYYIKANSQAKGNLQGVYDYLAHSDPQSASDMVTYYGGPKNFASVVDKQNEDLEKKKADDEKVRHDEAVEKISALKEADKADKENAYVGNDNAATPQEYLASLKPSEAATVKGIAEGSLDVGRMSYLLARNPALIAAVKRYDPNFDNSKVAGYAKMVTDFTSGKVGESLKYGATAANHLRELYDLNTAAARIPGTAANQRYENKLETVASELAGFYGNNTVSGIQGYKDTLNATFNRGPAILEQAKSMNDRYDNIKRQWIAGSPSDTYQGKMPDISPKAKADLAFLVNGGKVPAAQPAQPAQQPQQQQPATVPAQGGQPTAQPAAQPAQPQVPQDGPGFFGNFGGKAR